MTFKKYAPVLNEDFEIGSETKILEKVCSILSRRIGSKISVSKVPVEVSSDVGHVEGIQAFIADGRKLRFDFRIGESSKVIAIHFWNSLHFQPDLVIQTHDKNIVSIIEIIMETLQSGRPEEFIFTESTSLNEDVVVTSKTQGKISKDISDAINAWASQMELGEHDLQNRRIKDLYKSFLFWKREVETSSEFKEISESSFRNYIIQYLAKYNLTNIFMRKVIVQKAGKEISIITDTAETKKFDKEILGLSLQDQLDFLKHMISAVIQGKKNSLVICGSAGVGKSRTVKEILMSEKGSKHIIWDAGLIKKVEDLYKLFYKYRTNDNIIVFDDTPIVEIKAFRPILLSALAPEPKRIMTMRSEDFIDPDEIMKGDKYSRELNADSKKIPSTFIFEASVIVTTNVPKKKIDNAIVSRTSPIELNAEKGDVIDTIRVNIDKVIHEFKSFGEVSREEALEVLNFIEEHKEHVNNIDFRLFRDCLAVRAVVPPSNLWKKFVLMILQNYR